MDTDLLIIGGGINGVGIAAEAAERGLRVVLCDKGDLGGATSSASSKLIHGGLRYLEQYDFKLVRHALREREVLMKKAPYMIWPMRFIMPYDADIRPRWLMRLGFLLYDCLDWKRTLPRTSNISFNSNDEMNPLHKKYKTGFCYSDCWVDDARLVIVNALHAQNHGATILPYNECFSLTEAGTLWTAKLIHTKSKNQITVHARCVINAAGPWAIDIIKTLTRRLLPYNIQCVRGSHIITKALYKGTHAYTLQNKDNRIVFVLPYEGSYSLIGTTEAQHNTSLDQVNIADHETKYLCQTIQDHFKKNISKKDILSSYSGVRPLFDDHQTDVSKVSRDYHLHFDHPKAGPPLLSILGGKITTFRRLAVDAIDRLQNTLTIQSPSLSHDSQLPGSEPFLRTVPDYITFIQTNWPWLPEALTHRYAQAYGTRCSLFLNDAFSLSTLGQHFGHSLYQREVDYLIQHEWASTAEDILWRRSKLGLLFSDEQTLQLSAHIMKKNR